MKEPCPAVGFTRGYNIKKKSYENDILSIFRFARTFLNLN